MVCLGKLINPIESKVPQERNLHYLHERGRNPNPFVRSSSHPITGDTLSRKPRESGDNHYVGIHYEFLFTLDKGSLEHQPNKTIAILGRVSVKIGVASCLLLAL